MILLPPPEENLKVSVVVPARDEEDLIRACLDALAAQVNIPPEEYEVLLVLDDCKDRTELRAQEAATSHPKLRLRFLGGPGKGAGHARRIGMDAACERLLMLGKPYGLISSTDADTVVAQDWLSTQLLHAKRGARAIGGRIELAEEENLPENLSRWRQDQGTSRYQNLLAEHNEISSNILEHWQFSGASLSLTAEVYREIGGLEPLAALEDEYLERVLRQRGVQIERPLSVRVRTSARQNGRADRGLARDLALASWFHHNTYRFSDFDVENLVEIKDQTVSLFLTGESFPPGTMTEVNRLQKSGLLDEVLVVGPVPAAAESKSPAILAIHRMEDLVPKFGPARGCGDVLWRGISAARGELIVALAQDRGGDFIGRVCGLLGPLLERRGLSLVKGFGAAPGPLSDLVARPLINLHHPRLAGFVDPLCQDFAARGELLRSLSFPVGRGVDISLLLDAVDRCGVDATAQCYLEGSRAGPDPDDSEAAYAILVAAAGRMPGVSPEAPIPGPLFLPGPGDLATRRVPVEERPPLEGLSGAGSAAF